MTDEANGSNNTTLRAITLPAGQFLGSSGGVYQITATGSANIRTIGYLSLGQQLPVRDRAVITKKFQLGR